MKAATRTKKRKILQAWYQARIRKIRSIEMGLQICTTAARLQQIRAQPVMQSARGAYKQAQAAEIALAMQVNWAGTQVGQADPAGHPAWAGALKVMQQMAQAQAAKRAIYQKAAAMLHEVSNLAAALATTTETTRHLGTTLKTARHLKHHHRK